MFGCQMSRVKTNRQEKEAPALEARKMSPLGAALEKPAPVVVALEEPAPVVVALEEQT
jgi:hypothetical protein